MDIIILPPLYPQALSSNIIIRDIGSTIHLDFRVSWWYEKLQIQNLVDMYRYLR